MKKIIASLGLTLIPGIVFAQAADIDADGTLGGILGAINQILNLLIPILITLAIIFFFWGLAKFILNAGDPAAQEQGRSIMIWGVVALFVIVTVWGLVAVLQDTFKTTEDVESPTVDSFGSIPPTAAP